MPQIQNIVINAGRKVSQNYQTRETNLIVTLEPAEGEDPVALIKEWTAKLQRYVDASVGDSTSQHAFGTTSRAINSAPAPNGTQSATTATEVPTASG